MTTNSVDNDRIERATAFAQEYDALMGLSMVPLGAGLILTAITDNAFWMLFGALAAFVVIGWYNRKYGAVRPKPGRTVVMALGTVVALVLITAGDVLDRYLDPPVSLSLLAVTISIAIGSWLMSRRTGQTPAHWIAFALLLLMAFGPAVGIGSVGLFVPYTLIPLGIVFIVLGLTDHRRFVQLIGPAPTESE